MRRVLAVGLVVISSSFVATPLASAAGDGQPPALTDLRLGMASVSVAGIQTSPVEVVLDLNDPDGVQSGGQLVNGEDPEYTPDVEFTRSSDGAVFDVANFQLVAGSVTNGTWAASWPAAASQNGTWTATDVHVEDRAGNRGAIDPRTQGITRMLTINGREAPVLTFNISAPSVLHRGSVARMYGTLRASDGTAFNGEVVHAGVDTGCAESFGEFPVMVSTTGTWSFVVAHPENDVGALMCTFYLLPGDADPFHAVGMNAVIQRRVVTFHRQVQYTFLSVVPSATSARAGTSVAVNGSLWPAAAASQGRVILQREVGTAWRFVASAHVRASGRFTVDIASLPRGRITYRVIKASDVCSNGSCTFLGTVSRTFTITGI